MRNVSFIKISAVFCVIILSLSSCKKPDDFDDTTAAVAETVSTEITAEATTTTGATETTETIVTTVQAAMTRPETETAAETAATTETAAATTLATTAAATTAPATTTHSPIPVMPKISYPPAKSYTYAEPYYKGFKLFERVDYHEDGRVIASSHLNNNAFAGFAIDYIPGDTFGIFYTTSEGTSNYNGKHPVLEIDLDDDIYGRIYIGESLDGSWNGEGYLLWDYNDEECGWYSYTDGKPDGTEYFFSGSEMYIDIYKAGVTEPVSSTKLTREIDSTGGYYYNLDESGNLKFVVTADYTGCVKNNKKHYFGFIRASDSSYRGQLQNGVKQGLGITLWNSGDILLGQFENDQAVYGYFYEKATKKSYFVKNINGALTIIEEMKGIDVDFNRIFG
jgi:hypothetical protein